MSIIFKDKNRRVELIYAVIEDIYLIMGDKEKTRKLYVTLGDFQINNQSFYQATHPVMLTSVVKSKKQKKKGEQQSEDKTKFLRLCLSMRTDMTEVNQIIDSIFFAGFVL